MRISRRRRQESTARARAVSGLRLLLDGVAHLLEQLPTKVLRHSGINLQLFKLFPKLLLLLFHREAVETSILARGHAIIVRVVPSRALS